MTHEIQMTLVLIALILGMMVGLCGIIWVLAKTIDFSGEVEMDIKFKEHKKSK